MRARTGLRPAAAFLSISALTALVITACDASQLPDAQPTQTENIKSNPPSTPAAPSSDPFAGSPAQKYANGADGIQLPKAKAAAGFSASQVRAHLKTVKMAMSLANLDAKVWRGVRPKNLFGLLEPKGGSRAEAERSFSRPTDSNTPLLYVTRFDPKRAVVHGQIVKVHGKMTFRSDKRGLLQVHTNYLYVYAVRQPGPLVGQVRRVVVRRTIDYEFANPALFQATPGKFILHRDEYSYAGAGCDDSKGFLRPDFETIVGDGSDPSGAPVDPYDLDREAESEGCHEATRT
jgi:hypothetical protein